MKHSQEPPTPHHPKASPPIDICPLQQGTSIGIGHSQVACMPKESCLRSAHNDACLSCLLPVSLLAPQQRRDPRWWIPTSCSVTAQMTCLFVCPAALPSPCSRAFLHETSTPARHLRWMQLRRLYLESFVPLASESPSRTFE